MLVVSADIYERVVFTDETCFIIFFLYSAEENTSGRYIYIYIYKVHSTCRKRTMEQNLANGIALIGFVSA